MTDPVIDFQEGQWWLVVLDAKANEVSGPAGFDMKRAVAVVRNLMDSAHAPIDMVLFCPACGTQHIDEPERHLGRDNSEEIDWTNPPHRSHLCHSCGHIWRPADVPTNGVLAVQTKGKADSELTAPRQFLDDADIDHDFRGDGL